MKKVYLRDLTPEQVTERLNKGEIIYNVNFPDWRYKYINGILCGIGSNSIVYNDNIHIRNASSFFFKEQEPLNIKLGKFYETRDGRKAYCCSILRPCILDTYGYYFIIEGSYVSYSTDRDGKHLTDTESALDIIEEWKD